ncbi:MAG: hypothetical protein LBI87_03870 [Candidatus Accumulibacter sp.]|jgi:hypothetical protein|nr:hypothetical protein [Accumulibacter sp.]
MSARPVCLLLAAALSAAACQASERLSVCFNYGCAAEAEVVYSDAQLEELARRLGGASTPAGEREAIGEAVGRLLGWAGQQSPIGADRGGNYADDGVDGRMDCVDHAMTATRLLRLMARRGWLRFHRVLEPALRLRFMFLPHYAAMIEETREGESGERGERGKCGEEARPPARFIVDAWFFDNGHPAAVMPLDDWRKGENPDDAE